MKVVRLSALRTGRLYPQEGFLVLISFRATMQPEGLSLKHSSVPFPASSTCDFKCIRIRLYTSAQNRVNNVRNGVSLCLQKKKSVKYRSKNVLILLRKHTKYLLQISWKMMLRGKRTLIIFPTKRNR
jgi:hypothetical protein